MNLYPFLLLFVSHIALSQTDCEGQNENPDKNPELLDLSESGTQSTYFDVEIITEEASIPNIFS